MRKVRFSIFITMITGTFSACAQENSNLDDDQQIAYIGCYTSAEDAENEGIYYVSQDTKTGKLVPGKVLAAIKNPSFVKVSPDKKTLYAVSELSGEGVETGFIYSYKINSDNSLTEINKLETHGTAPCHISIDNTGNFVFVANYLGGVVMVYERLSNGGLKEFQKLEFENPKESHTHSVTISGDNEHIYIADLGNDKIWMYDLDTEKKTVKKSKMPFVELKDGAGPRHFTFSPNAEFAYVINEVSSTISVFEVEKNGGLHIIQNISTLPKDYKEKNSGADIHIENTGRYLYASNRGHNSLASFKIDKKSGKLKTLGFTSTGGETPRNFAISPSGKYAYVANQNSGNIVSYEINSKNGELSQIQNIQASSPVCIEFKN